MKRRLRDDRFLGAVSRQLLDRPSHVLANSTIEVHDRNDGLEVHIVLTNHEAICFAWIHDHAYLLPGTSPKWLTVDDLFDLEDVTNGLIGALLKRHRITVPPCAKRGAA